MKTPTVSKIDAPPTDRLIALDRIRAELVSDRRVVLTTHVHADGDGAGSEAALGRYLRRRGLHPAIVNPTPFPDEYTFLLGDLSVSTPREESGREALEQAELVISLDTSEPSRLGIVASHLRGRRVAVLDHHPPTATSMGEPALLDPTACATGELVYDLIAADGGTPTKPEAEGLYVAIATDTGSFRFGNTTPRTHRIAAELLAAGVDPEAMYRHLYARLNRGRIDLIRRALSRLTVHEELPVATITLSAADLAETGTTRDDLEGIVDYARRMEGVEVAVLLRDLGDGRTKISLRSTGEADVAAIARGLGGGGHTKAAGAIVERPAEGAEPVVLEAIRSALRAGGGGPG